MNEPTEIRVNIPFRGRQLAEFLAIKEHLGIRTNADVVRYLVRRHARALQRRERGELTQRRRGAEAQGEGARDAPPGEREGEAQDYVCLECPLPECDEGDPRCPYQQVAGGSGRERARSRAYMRRTRAK